MKTFILRGGTMATELRAGLVADASASAEFEQMEAIASSVATALNTWSAALSARNKHIVVHPVEGGAHKFEVAEAEGASLKITYTRGRRRYGLCIDGVDLPRRAPQLGLSSSLRFVDMDGEACKLYVA